MIDDDQVAVVAKIRPAIDHLSPLCRPNRGPLRRGDGNPVILELILAPETGNDLSLHRPRELDPRRRRFSRRKLPFEHRRLFRPVTGNLQNPPRPRNEETIPGLNVCGIGDPVDPAQLPDIHPVGLGDPEKGLARTDLMIDPDRTRFAPDTGRQQKAEETHDRDTRRPHDAFPARCRRRRSGRRL